MNAEALAGLGVLVTRPEPQAAPLARLLEAHGASIFRLPAIAVCARPDRAAIRAALGPLDRYQWLIFVSANAVRFGIYLLEERRELRLAAVGPATAAALNHAGFRVSLVPTGGYDSESLLAEPELQHVHGQRIAIVRGEGGRELLGEVLAARGAEVSYADVYTRARPEYPPETIAAVETALAEGVIDVITATSGEIVENLLELLTPAGRESLRRATLLAGSRRIADRARELGLDGPVIIADRADDAGLKDALLFWRRHTFR
jgi:uroporphyrinogen-III synthase